MKTTNSKKSLSATFGKSFVALLFMGMAIFFAQALVNLMKNPDDLPISDGPRFVGFIFLNICAVACMGGFATFLLWAFGIHPRDVFFKKGLDTKEKAESAENLKTLVLFLIVPLGMAATYATILKFK